MDSPGRLDLLSHDECRITDRTLRNTLSAGPVRGNEPRRAVAATYCRTSVGRNNCVRDDFSDLARGWSLILSSLMISDVG